MCRRHDSSKLLAARQYGEQREDGNNDK